MQYYTGTQGYVQSYGFGSGQLLSSQNYKACIRQEQGYCSIDWHPSSRTNPDSFNMINGDFTAGTPPAADVNNGVNAIGDCLANYINIPDAMTYTSNNKYTELCGEVWATDGTELALGPLRCELSVIRVSSIQSSNFSLHYSLHAGGLLGRLH